MHKHSLYAYPWDLPGIGQVDIARLRGELDALGVQGLTLAASYHAGKFISPRGNGRVTFPEDGAVYFAALPERYGALKPLVSQVVDRRVDPFATLAADGRIPVDAWVVLNHNYRLGTVHPQCTVQNLWGDSYPYSLCPTHPETQAYARALCIDIAEQGIATALSIESPGFMVYAHGFHHEFQQVEMNAWVDAVLGLCFCPQCVAGIERESIDVTGLQRRLAHALRQYLTSNAAPSGDMAASWLLADLLGDDDLRAMIRWRCDAVTALVASIRDAVPKHVGVNVIATCQRPHATAFLEGMDLKALAAVADAIEFPFYQSSAERVEADAFDALRRVSDGKAHLRAILRPGPPDMTSPGQLADTVARLQQQGIADCSFYNYGMLRTRDFQSIATI